jgi:hypothetical protein
MKTFLQRFGRLVLGNFRMSRRLVTRSRSRQLSSPEEMNCYLSASAVLHAPKGRQGVALRRARSAQQKQRQIIL